MSIVFKPVPIDKKKQYIVKIAAQIQVSLENNNEIVSFSYPHYWQVDILNSLKVEEAIDVCIKTFITDLQHCTSGSFSFVVDELPGNRSEKISGKIDGQNVDMKTKSEEIKSFLTKCLILQPSLSNSDSNAAASADKAKPAVGK